MVGGPGLVLALTASVYVLVDAADPLLRHLQPQVAMSVLDSCFFFVDMASCTTGKKQPISSAWKTAA